MRGRRDGRAGTPRGVHGGHHVGVVCGGVAVQRQSALHVRHLGSECDGKGLPKVNERPALAPRRPPALCHPAVEQNGGHCMGRLYRSVPRQIAALRRRQRSALILPRPEVLVVHLRARPTLVAIKPVSITGDAYGHLGHMQWGSTRSHCRWHQVGAGADSPTPPL